VGFCDLQDAAYAVPAGTCRRRAYRSHRYPWQIAFRSHRHRLRGSYELLPYLHVGSVGVTADHDYLHCSDPAWYLDCGEWPSAEIAAWQSRCLDVPLHLPLDGLHPQRCGSRQCRANSRDLLLLLRPAGGA